MGLSNCLATKRPDLAKEWHPTLNGDLTPYNVTTHSDIKIWWKCSECGNVWKISISKRYGQNGKGTGCPDCSQSYGKKYIIFCLKVKQVNYISQKTFNGLIGLGGCLLSYDFYLPKYNLLIEYQGNFHDGSSGEYSKLNLVKQQEHDKRKKEYAQSNGYKLLEIWYWDFDNIEEILTDYLKELENSSFLVY